MNQLRTLPRHIVLEALKLLDFAEYEIRPTHTLMWGLGFAGNGEGVLLRVPGFERIPPSAQEAWLFEAHISVAQWLYAVAQVENRLKFDT